MESVIFYLLSAVILISAVCVVFLRRPMHNVLSMIVVMVGLAGLFILLNAEFIGMVQLVVYAGAVMVLFLFVIMLLDLKAEERRKIKARSIAGGLISVGAILVIFLGSLRQAPLGAAESPALEGGTVRLGKLLFTEYLLPFEIVSVLLLVAMVGVVLLSKKDLK
jgi:NADH-quinone oxidoreductase subunit J